MSNINGNKFPVWGINVDNQVFAVDSNNKVYPMSDPGFAAIIGISENGILWAVSTTPEPDSGSVLYSSIGDGKWVPVGTNIPGATLLTGTGENSAIYVTEDDALWSITLNAEAYVFDNVGDIQEIDYGGGFLWALFPTQPGGIPCLQSLNFAQVPGKWQPFKGVPQPMGISANYNGDCYGAVAYNPVYFSKDGATTASAGAGANGITLEMSFKNTYYLLSENADENGNDVMFWQDEKGGVFVDAGFKAIQVLATYYQ